MIWEEWLNAVSGSIGTTTTQAGIIMSLILTISIIISILIVTRGRKAGITIPFISLFCIILFTYIGWFPLYTGSVIALALAIIIAKIIRW